MTIFFVPNQIFQISEHSEEKEGRQEERKEEGLQPSSKEENQILTIVFFSTFHGMFLNDFTSDGKVTFMLHLTPANVKNLNVFKE